MQILLTNDDGPAGPGLASLRRALSALGEVTVVCPAEERSGIGHAISYRAPMEVATVRLADGTEVRTLTGNPADCVKFALVHLYERPPDLVVSGPNLGVNTGFELFYSGTVAAAREGGFAGITSVAVSTAIANADRMDRVAALAVRILNVLLKERPGRALVFNVNIPHLSDGEPDVRITRQCLAFPRETHLRAAGPQGRLHYVLGSPEEAAAPSPDSDVAAVAAGHVSITPLRADLTDQAALEALAERLSVGARGA